MDVQCPQSERGAMMKCEFVDCDREAEFRCFKLWGKGGTICTCREHTPANGREEYPKPGGDRLKKLNHLRPFYRVEAIELTTGRGESQEIAADMASRTGETTR